MITVKTEPQPKRVTRASVLSPPIDPVSLGATSRRTRSSGVDNELPLELPKRTRKRSPRATPVPQEHIAPPDSETSSSAALPTDDSISKNSSEETFTKNTTGAEASTTTTAESTAGTHTETLQVFTDGPTTKTPPVSPAETPMKPPPASKTGTITEALNVSTTADAPHMSTTWATTETSPMSTDGTTTKTLLVSTAGTATETPHEYATGTTTETHPVSTVGITSKTSLVSTAETPMETNLVSAPVTPTDAPLVSTTGTTNKTPAVSTSVTPIETTPVPIAGTLTETHLPSEEIKPSTVSSQQKQPMPHASPAVMLETAREVQSEQTAQLKTPGCATPEPNPRAPVTTALEVTAKANAEAPVPASLSHSPNTETAQISVSVQPENISTTDPQKAIVPSVLLNESSTGKPESTSQADLGVLSTINHTQPDQLNETINKTFQPEKLPKSSDDAEIGTNSEKDNTVKLSFDFRDAMETELVVKNNSAPGYDTDRANNGSPDSNLTEMYTDAELKERLAEVENPSGSDNKTPQTESVTDTDDPRGQDQDITQNEPDRNLVEKNTKPSGVTELKHQNIMFGLLMATGDKRQFYCNFCLAKSDDEPAFMEHVSTHLFVCGVCRYQTFTRVEVVRHILEAHPRHQNPLTRLHTMHLENEPLKPQQLNLSLKKRGDKRRSWSNVLAGTIVRCTKALEKMTVATQYEEPMDLCNGTLDPVCNENSASNSDIVEPKDTTSGVEVADSGAEVPQTNSDNNPLTEPSDDNPSRDSSNDNPPRDSSNDNPSRDSSNDNPSRESNSDNPPRESNNDNPPRESDDTDSSKLGINVLDENAKSSEENFFIAIDRNAESVPSTKLFQCRRCSFRDYDVKVVELHQKAHRFNKLTVVLSAYGVICPYCQTVHRTLQFMFEHLDSMHQQLVPCFFLVMRCMGANDLYYFCPCCNAVNSDHMKHIVMKHVLSNHSSMKLYTLLWEQLKTDIMAERYYVDLWVNGFRLNKIETLTVVIPDTTPKVMEAPTPIEPAAEKPETNLNNSNSSLESSDLEGNEGDLSAPDSQCPSTENNQELIPTLPQLVDPVSLATFMPAPPPLSADVGRAALDIPPFVNACDSTIFRTSDICKAFPELDWLREQYPKQIVRLRTTKTYGRMLVLYAEHIPTDCVLLNFREYFFRRQDGIPECKLCAKTFVSVQLSRQRPLQHVEEHVFCHFDVKIWMCPFCRSSHKKRCDVVFHIRAMHPSFPFIILRNLPYLPKKVLQSATVPGESPLPEPRSLSSNYPLKKNDPQYVYVCFFCPRQTNSRGLMLRHVRYVHPSKPFSRCMYQKYLQFIPDIPGELYRIERGLFQARVCVVRVEDMEEFEGLDLLLNNKVPPEDEQDEEDRPKINQASRTNTTGTYECIYCPYSSEKLESNKSHILLAHANFSPVVRYKRSASSPRPRTKKKKDGQMLYLCPVCSFFSDRRSSIVDHARRYPVHFTFLNGQDFMDAIRSYPPQRDVYEAESGVTLRENPEAEAEQRPSPLKRVLLEGSESGTNQEETGEPPEKRPLISASNIKREPVEHENRLPGLKCCLCDHREWSCSNLKFHYRLAHPKCAMIAIDVFKCMKIFMCPEDSCDVSFEVPGLVMTHLMNNHNGDPNQLRFAYTEKQIAFQQYTMVSYQREIKNARVKPTSAYATAGSPEVHSGVPSSIPPTSSESRVMAVTQLSGGAGEMHLNAPGGMTSLVVPAEVMARSQNTTLHTPQIPSTGHGNTSAMSASSCLANLMSMVSASKAANDPMSTPPATVMANPPPPEQEPSLPQILSVTGAATDFAAGGVTPNVMTGNVNQYAPGRLDPAIMSQRSDDVYSRMAPGSMTGGMAQFSSAGMVSNPVNPVLDINTGGVTYTRNYGAEHTQPHERPSGVYIDYEG